LQPRLAACEIIDHDAPIDDLLDGPRQVAVNLILADDLLRAA